MALEHELLFYFAGLLALVAFAYVAKRILAGNACSSCPLRESCSRSTSCPGKKKT